MEGGKTKEEKNKEKKKKEEDTGQRSRKESRREREESRLPSAAFCLILHHALDDARYLKDDRAHGK